MDERFEKLAFVVLGSAVVTKKKIDAFVDDLIQSNSLTEKEGEVFASMLLKKFKQEEKAFEKVFQYKAPKSKSSLKQKKSKRLL